MDQARPGDAIIVSELSRLGRSMLECMEILSIAAEKKINVYAVKGHWQLDGSMQSKIMAMVFSMAAEIERDLISQRTKNGLARVKAEGKKLGNPNLKADNRKRIEKANAFAENLRGTITSFIKDGFTQRQIVKELNRINVRTPRGNEFKLTTLQRAMKRLDLSTVHTR